jgi:hypothetical protein
MRILCNDLGSSSPSLEQINIRDYYHRFGNGLSRSYALFESMLLISEFFIERQFKIAFDDRLGCCKVTEDCHFSST